MVPFRSLDCGCEHKNIIMHDLLVLSRLNRCGRSFIYRGRWGGGGGLTLLPVRSIVSSFFSFSLAKTAYYIPSLLISPSLSASRCLLLLLLLFLPLLSAQPRRLAHSDTCQHFPSEITELQTRNVPVLNLGQVLQQKHMSCFYNPPSPFKFNREREVLE